MESQDSITLSSDMIPRGLDASCPTSQNETGGTLAVNQPQLSADPATNHLSFAGFTYDAADSSGTNYGPTNQKLVARVKEDVAALQSENQARPVPIDEVTTSASGLDPDITPANADFQIPRVAKARGIPEPELSALVKQHTNPRQLSILGEPRVNVLELNLALDKWHTHNGDPK